MSLEDFGRIEVWAATFLAALAFAWKGVTMIFSLRGDVDANTLRIEAMEKDVLERFDNLRQDIKDIGEKTESRHNTMDAKLDQLIMRSIK